MYILRIRYAVYLSVTLGVPVHARGHRVVVLVERLASEPDSSPFGSVAKLITTGFIGLVVAVVLAVTTQVHAYALRISGVSTLEHQPALKLV